MYSVGEKERLLQEFRMSAECVGVSRGHVLALCVKSMSQVSSPPFPTPVPPLPPVLLEIFSASHPKTRDDRVLALPVPRW